MKLQVSQIRERALDYLDKAPQGIRYMALVKMVHDSAPETPINTVHGAFQTLISKTKEVVRPSKGLWVLKKHADADVIPQPEILLADTETRRGSGGKKAKFLEEDFYAPFSEWLKTEVEKVVETLVMGGSRLKSKWGTPDVVGINKPRQSDFYKFQIEIVSAEIKIDPTQSIVAFGQACA